MIGLLGKRVFVITGIRVLDPGQRRAGHLDRRVSKEVGPSAIVTPATDFVTITMEELRAAVLSRHNFAGVAKTWAFDEMRRTS